MAKRNDFIDMPLGSPPPKPARVNSASKVVTRGGVPMPLSSSPASGAGVKSKAPAGKMSPPPSGGKQRRLVPSNPVPGKTLIKSPDRTPDKPSYAGGGGGGGVKAK